MTDFRRTGIANHRREVYTFAPAAMETSVMLICVTAACFLLAGAVKGVTGMGLPTVVMCTLVLVMPGSRAAALLVVPSLVTNVWQLFAGPGLGEVARRLALMQVFSFAGTFVGIGYLTGKSSPVGSAVLGGVLCVYALMALMSVKLEAPRRWEPFISPFIGLATGVLGGATGLFVVPAVPYIAALGFSGNHLIKALGLSFGVSTISLALALAWKGAFGMQMAGASALALLPAMAGMMIGEAIRRRLPPETFKRWFLIAVLLVGLSMLAKAWL